MAGFLENIAHKSARLSGTSYAFLGALGITLGWLAMGPIFAFSTTWQLTMDTICSTVAFIMVFIIQRSQNKNSLAMQIKLNEIIAALQGANNHIINIEDLSEDEILRLSKRYQELALRIHKGTGISTHTVATDGITH